VENLWKTTGQFCTLFFDFLIGLLRLFQGGTRFFSFWRAGGQKAVLKKKKKKNQKEKEKKKIF
jgi:hypothetical protein